MKRRILFVSGYPNNIDKYLYVFFRNLIFALADIGVECYVVSPVSVTKYRRRVFDIPKEEVQFTSKGNKVYVKYPRFISTSSKQVWRFNTGYLTNMNYINAVIKTVKELKIDFDAVYGHFFISGGLAAIKLGNMLGIPSFVAYGECDWESQVIGQYRNLKKKDVEGLSGIISVSQKNSAEIKKAGIFDDIPIETFENAVDMSLFGNCSREEARKKFNLPEDKFIVGFVGGFIERKGDKRLIEACKGIDDVYLAFAGKGDNPPRGENVVFCDNVNHDEIGVFLSAIDVFCLPTLNEGCCNAVLEAMAAGKAIISSDLPFNDGVLTNENSIRINPNSIDEIRNAIIKLCDDKELLNKLSEKAQEDSKNFTIERRAEKILNFIKSLS